MKKAYFRTTLVDGKPKGPRELFVDGVKVCDMTKFEIIDLVIDAMLVVRDTDAQTPTS